MNNKRKGKRERERERERERPKTLPKIYGDSIFWRYFESL